LKERITNLLRQRGSRLLAIKEIADRLADPDATRDDVARAVEEMERDGLLLPVRGKRYSLLEFTPYHAGRIRVHPDGYGTIYGGGDTPDIYIDLVIEAGASMDARAGEMVNVELDRYPDRTTSHASGRVVEVLGFIGDPGVDIEVVIRKHHIPHIFPPEVLAAAEDVPVEV